MLSISTKHEYASVRLIKCKILIGLIALSFRFRSPSSTSIQRLLIGMDPFIVIRAIQVTVKRATNFFVGVFAATATAVLLTPSVSLMPLCVYLFKIGYLAWSCIRHFCLLFNVLHVSCNCKLKSQSIELNWIGLDWICCPRHTIIKHIFVRLFLYRFTHSFIWCQSNVSIQQLKRLSFTFFFLWSSR